MKKRKLLCLVLAALITGSTVIGVGAARFLGDVNNDGKVNNKDYVLLMRYLNGWDVELK